MKKYLIILTKVITLILFLIWILFRYKPMQELGFLPLIGISIAMIDLLNVIFNKKDKNIL